MTTTTADAAGLDSRRWTIDDIFDRPGSVRAMAVLRIALGPVVIVHLWPFLSATAAGTTYDEHFFEPWWSWVPEVPGTVQVALVWGAAVAAVAMAAGWHTRIATAATTLGVAGNLFLSQTHFRHNRAFLVILLVFVTLSASGKVLSLDARRRPTQTDGRRFDRDTVWPMFTLRAVVSSVYFASGFSKLIDPDWVGGLILWDRAVRFQDLVGEQLPGVVADPLVDIVTTRWVHTLTSPIAVAIELFVAFGLWFARTRIAAVWVAILFHLSIEISASVEVFSLAAIAALAIWATPATRDRIITVAPNELRWIEPLDWLARFEVRRAPGAEITVVDRDGTVVVGRDARRLILSRLPLTFFFVAPWRRWR